MENAKIKNMYDLSQSIAGEYLSQFTYPWEALKGISDFIKKLGPELDPEIYEKRGGKYMGGKECNRCAYCMPERTADY